MMLRICIIALLLLSNVEANEVNTESTIEQEKALSKATKNGNIEEVEALLKLGTDVDAKLIRFNRNIPLFVAVRNNDLAMVKVLVKHGVAMKTPNGRQNVLDLIGKKQSVELLEYLLKNGADGKYVNRDGDTLLHNLANIHFRAERNVPKWKGASEACTKYKLDLIKLLVEYGVDVNAVNEENETAIYLAFKERKKCVVNYLVKKGADSKVGKNLFFTVDWRNSVEELDLLLKLGYDVNEISKEYQQSALFNLVKNGYNPELIEFLLENGADINLEDKKKNTALSLSVSNRHKKMQAFLISKGAKKTDKYHAELAKKLKK